jgi:chromosome segregation ATPase
MNQNQNQYKQFIQNMKNQHVQYVNRIKMLETELNKCKEDAAQNSNVLKLENIQLKEIFNSDMEKKSQQLDFANNKLKELSAELDAKTAELDAKTAELECSNKKINEMLEDLDKKSDAFRNIDKIIFRNNEYFDEIKKELNDKIAHNKEVDELYNITKTELQLYKNDFILKSATF